MINDPQCLACCHFDRSAPRGTFRCRAFWDGIPMPILLAKYDHRKPWPGDRGFRFEPFDASPDLIDRDKVVCLDPKTGRNSYRPTSSVSKIRPPERVEGPTPNGGAYSIAYYGPDDKIAEIVEFDATDREIGRTYCANSSAWETSRPEAEDMARDDQITVAPPGEDGELRREKVEQPDFSDEDLAIMDEVWREIGERGWDGLRSRRPDPPIRPEADEDPAG